MIAFTSDFGTSDWYVGAVKAVLATRAPGVRVVDLCHGIPPGAVSSGAFVLAVNSRFFPQGTVQLAVVDPGVGSSRRAVALRARGQFWVGPDNGLFGPFLDADDLNAVELDLQRLAVDGSSSTFHGRDVFAVAAARLAVGDALSALGPEARDLIEGEAWWRRAKGAILARVLWIDTFGNVITGVPASVLAEFAPEPMVEIQGQRIQGLQRSFHEVAPGESLLYLGSSGTLEIAMRNANAARMLGIQVGAEITIRPVNAKGTSK